MVKKEITLLIKFSIEVYFYKNNTLFIYKK